MKAFKATVQRGGANLTFNIGGGARKGLSLHLGLLELNLDRQYADMTMREIAEMLAKHFEFKRGEIEFVRLDFAKREESKSHR